MFPEVQKFQIRHRVSESAVFWRKNSLRVTINAETASLYKINKI